MTEDYPVYSKLSHQKLSQVLTPDCRNCEHYQDWGKCAVNQTHLQSWGNYPNAAINCPNFHQTRIDLATVPEDIDDYPYPLNYPWVP
jgi:hypothetical protein